jgi:hypothetical protein
LVIPTIRNAPHSGAAIRPQAQWVVSSSDTLTPAHAMYPAVIAPVTAVSTPM